MWGHVLRDSICEGRHEARLGREEGATGCRRNRSFRQPNREPEMGKALERSPEPRHRGWPPVAPH